jgi:hypothetical protein
MVIKDKVIVVLGGYGEVGSAICRQIVPHRPKELIVTSLREEEALAAIGEFPQEASEKCKLTPFHGNLFVRWSLKNIPPSEISSAPEYLRCVADDMLGELTEEILTSSTLYRLISEYQPDILVDCVNTATALAYQNVYQCYEEMCQGLQKPLGKDEQISSIYKVLSTTCVPPLVRHIQILYESMKRFNTLIYLKVGTTGTGGMGLNIPFTHGEESPSRLLMSKAAAAGAHSMLLFVLSRVPGGPTIKEIKPAAMIGWKGVKRGRIVRSGRSFPRYDCLPDNAFRLTAGATFRYFEMKRDGALQGSELEGVYVDTGENGLFSLDEFKLVTGLGLMEFLTPEEIAHTAIQEIQGVSTSKDIVGALGGAVMGPSYRAGVLRDTVVKHAECLRNQATAYGFMGPLVTKLIFEAQLLKLCYGTLAAVLKTSSSEISQTLEEHVSKDETIRSDAISIGIPILLPDGERLLFSRRPIADKNWEKRPWMITPEKIEDWVRKEWIDLRPQNIANWKERFQKVMQEAVECIEDNSSRFDRGQHFWPRDEEGNISIDPGEIVAWVLVKEYGGGRDYVYALPCDREA